jgi:hypothetical protein
VIVATSYAVVSNRAPMAIIAALFRGDFLELNTGAEFRSVLKVVASPDSSASDVTNRSMIHGAWIAGMVKANAGPTPPPV